MRSIIQGNKMARLLNTTTLRKKFLTTAFVASAIAMGSMAYAEQPSLSTEPTVWLNYDQAALDKAYDQVHWAPNIKTVLQRYVTNSEATRQRIDAPERIQYGSSEIETLDLFKVDQPKAPIHIFIHGGAWRGGEANEYSFLAEATLSQGAHFIVPDFINVLQTDGDLMPMAEQVARSIAWAYENAKSFGGDPDQIYLSGHSSGAHLAAVALTKDWEKEANLPANIVKGAILISGLYDLKPARLSSRSSYVNFTDDIEHQLSPQRHIEALTTPITLIYGSDESPEFIRQTQDFAKALQQNGKPTTLLQGLGYNHFEILETLASPFGISGLVLTEYISPQN